MGATQAEKLAYIERDTGMDMRHLMAWARSIARKAGSKVPELRDDLPGDALLGLAEAIDSYDLEPREGYDRPPRFKPFARRIIFGRVVDEIRRYMRQVGAQAAGSDRASVRWVGPRADAGDERGTLADDGVTRLRRQPPSGDGPTMGLRSLGGVLGGYDAEVVDRPHVTAERLVDGVDAAGAYLASAPPRVASWARAIYLEGRPVAEVAAGAGVSTDAVRRALARESARARAFESSRVLGAPRGG